jgi:hypothetical protein
MRKRYYWSPETKYSAVIHRYSYNYWSYFQKCSQDPLELTRTSPKQDFAPQNLTEFIYWRVRVQVTQRNEQKWTANVVRCPARVRERRGKHDGVTCMFSLDCKISMCLLWESITTTHLFAASQYIPHILCNPNVYCHIHKCQPPVSTLSQLNPVHTPKSHFQKIHLNPLAPEFSFKF